MNQRKDDYMRGYGDGFKDGMAHTAKQADVMLKAVTGFPVSGPYLGADEARDICDAMLTAATAA